MHIGFIDICLLIVSISFEASISTFFFTNVLPVLLTILRVLSAESTSRLNVILEYLAQWHDILNNEVFQDQYVGLDTLNLACLAWLYVLFCA